MKLFRRKPEDRTTVRKTRLAIFFKCFATWTRTSCVGLNVAGNTTAHCLRERGVDAEAFAVRHNVDVAGRLAGAAADGREYTHVVISAPWLTAYDLGRLCEAYPRTRFAVLSHSHVAFLGADPDGIELMRRYASMSRTLPNLRVGGNSPHFSEWFSAAYGAGTVTLPNMYPCPHVVGKVWNAAYPVVRIGAFGAIRTEKNFVTAAAAALLISRRLGKRVELFMTTGGEAQGGTVMSAIRQMLDGVESVRLVEHEWQQWDAFIRLVQSMDLLLQPSHTESFNMVTADGVKVGVPSVVSHAVRWAPHQWKADADDAVAVADKGVELLLNDQGSRGSAALIEHNARAFGYWQQFLGC